MTDWVPVALSRSAEPGRVIGTSVRGQEIAIWRESTGAVHVWRDRCPHRGMRLSLGFVRDDQLGCPYHGWRFAPDGRCASVPAHPDLVMPATVAAQPLASHESSALIWVDLTGELSADRRGRADSPAASGGAGPYAGVRSVLVHSPADALAAQLESVTLTCWPDGAVGQWHGLLVGYHDGELLIGLQPLDEARTALHFCSRAAASAEFEVEVAQLAARLRDRQLARR